MDRWGSPRTAWRSAFYTLRGWWRNLSLNIDTTDAAIKKFIHSDEQFPHTQTHGKTRRIMQLQHPAPINMTATSHIRVSASDQGNKGRAGPRMRGPNYPWVRSTEHNAAGEKLDGASVRGWQRHNDPLWHRLGIAACLRWKMLRAQDKTVHRLMNSVHV